LLIDRPGLRVGTHAIALVEAKPGNFAVVQATGFAPVINRKTAKAFNLEFPPMLLALAAKVINNRSPHGGYGQIRPSSAAAHDERSAFGSG
jgi:hypothetical protein